jgi:hypothetical protein
MIELISWLQKIHQTLVHACQARHAARMATTPAPRTRPQGQRTSHGAHMARLARSMPEANPLTLEITANILLRYGLLDEKPPSKPPVGGTRRFVWLTRAATGWRR